MFKVAERAKWVSGMQVLKILSEGLLLLSQQIFSCHLIIPGRPSWETETWQWLIKFQHVKQWSTPLTYSAHLFRLFWDSHVESIKKEPDLSLMGRCQWWQAQVLCLRLAAGPSPWPTSSSSPRPLYSLFQNVVGTWKEEDGVSIVLFLGGSEHADYYHDLAFKNFI